MSDQRPLPVTPTPYPWWVLPGLASIVLAIFGGALIASCFIGNDTLQTQMFTGAYTLTTVALGYFFGSSASSAKKDDAAAVREEKTGNIIAASAAALATSAPVQMP